MTHTTNDRDADPIADGGHAAARGAVRRVVDRTPETPTAEVPPLGASDGGDDHPFDPMELSGGSLALPVVAALAVGVATQSSVAVGAGAAAAWIGSVAVPVVAVLAIFAGVKLL